MEGGAEDPWYRRSDLRYCMYQVFWFGLPLCAGYFAAGYPDRIVLQLPWAARQAAIALLIDDFLMGHTYNVM